MSLELKKKTVIQLKSGFDEVTAELSKYKLATTGKKDELVKRLHAFLNSKSNAGAEKVSKDEVAKPSSPVEQIDILTLRAMKFGPCEKTLVFLVLPKEADVLKKRVERFGVISASAAKAVSDEILQKRAARFGLVSHDSLLKKRAKEFHSSPVAKAADGDVLKKRIERFGPVSESVVNCKFIDFRRE